MRAPELAAKEKSLRRGGSLSKQQSFRRSSSMIIGPDGEPPLEKQVAAMRLVRKLRAFLSLPKVISFNPPSA